MRVLADSHAILWLSQRSPELSDVASEALFEAEETEGVVVSVASLVDLWYVTQSTKTITDAELAELREKISASSELRLGSLRDVPTGVAHLASIFLAR